MMASKQPTLQSQPRSPRHAGGFSMVEVMVAMVVAGIVLTGVFAFSSIQRGLANQHQREGRVQQSLDGAMWSIGQDIAMAGVGFARLCTEVRIWDNTGSRLLNPGALQDALALKDAAVDAVTGEPYWVLRDGLQAHWRSAGASSFPGTYKISSHRSSAADSFDVLMAEGNFANSSGMFRIDTSSWGTLATGASATLTLSSVATLDEGAVPEAVSAVLESSNPEHLSAVQQIFPPGSFVLIAPVATQDAAFRPAKQSQCVLLQVTGNVAAGATSTDWTLPVGSSSPINGNLETLLGLTGAAATAAPTSVAGGGTGDWLPSALDSSTVIPLGNLRWSRYEIDYSYAEAPYLVRTDIIGWVSGDPTVNSAGISYPSCPANACPVPQLRLPKLVHDDDSPPRVAIAPMIEDMQVSVGCDGYTAAGLAGISTSSAQYFPPPDTNYEEKGAANGNGPNFVVDEWDLINDRGNDEWLGNALEEEWAPDCVFYGTGEAYRDTWPIQVTSEASVGPGFRMSPQVIRVSLLGRTDDPALFRTNNSTSMSNAMEDRPSMASVVQQRTAHVASSRFAPRNLRWRDPAVE